MDLQNENHTGIVTRYRGTEQRYDVLLPAGKTVTLLETDCAGEKFRVGDILQFEIQESKRWRHIALHPVKESNVYLENLAHNFERRLPVSGYVYAKTDTGYAVNCAGYPCFLSDMATSYKGISYTPEDLLLKSHIFHINRIRNGNVFLSLKKFLIATYKRLLDEDMNAIHSGVPYTGTIIQVQDYGLLISNGTTTGLLYIRQIFTNNIMRLYFPAKADRKQCMAEALKNIFSEGEAIQVWIAEKEEFRQRYSLGWDVKASQNSKFSASINQHFPVADTSLEFTAIPLGISFSGIVNAVAGYGLFIRVELAVGLLHISQILPPPFVLQNLPRAERKKIETLLKLVFPEGTPITVWVEEQDGNRIVLGWDPTAPENEVQLYQLKLHLETDLGL